MKNRWYCAGATKGVLILAAEVLAVIFALNLFLLTLYPGVFLEWVSGKPAKVYENSIGFSNTLEQSAKEILGGLDVQEKFLSESIKDSSEVIDVKAYVEKGTLHPEESSKLEYRTSDLYQWSQKWKEEGEDSSDAGGKSEEIIVCQKQDGSYQYFWYQKFVEEIKSGRLRFAQAKENGGEATSTVIMESLKEGGVSEDNEIQNSVIQDKEGNVVYTNFWDYDGLWLTEEYPPYGKEDVLALANEDPQWNGNLDGAYRLIQKAIYQVGREADYADRITESYGEGDTNLVYLYCDFDKETVKTNRESFQSFDDLDNSLANIRHKGKFVIVTNRLDGFEANIQKADASAWKSMLMSAGNQNNNLLAIGVDTTYPIQDKFYQDKKLFDKYGQGGTKLIVLSMLSPVLFLIVLIWLTVVAGRKREDDGLHLIWLDKFPVEILAIAFLFGASLIMAPTLEYTLYNYQSYPQEWESAFQMYESVVPEMMLVAAGAVVFCGWFLTAYLSVVRKIKGKQVWMNSLTGRLWNFTKLFFNNLSQVWKLTLMFLGFLLIQVVAANSVLIFPGELWVLLIEGLIFIYLIRRTLNQKKIQKGIQQIAEGKVSYKIPLEGLKGDTLKMAEQVNDIGNGFDLAMEENLKNERMKTELITNVSHDIKTPLTSIINYTGLLKQEKFEDPKIQKYLDVIESKSQRLKNLTEDVVEASKASSGNITLECMNLNLVEMIQQVSGEFEERFQEKRMEEVLCLPEKEAVVYVDGRRMWRVLENIYGNATKYGMEGTRVYADLRIHSGNRVVFCLKNVSRYPLNIPAEELTERFIRGDISRSTEGSGLGLSIAKSLTELQGGSFEVYVDGDLFKITISFPLQAKRMPYPEETQDVGPTAQEETETPTTGLL